MTLMLLIKVTVMVTVSACLALFASNHAEKVAFKRTSRPDAGNIFGGLDHLLDFLVII